MGLITDKLSVGNSSLGNYTLDVSGNLKVESLKGTGIRIIVTDASGTFSTSAIPGVIDETDLVGIWGDGSDGDVTLSGMNTLSREMNYRNLTLNSGATLNTAGYIVRVSETLTMKPVSYISCDGSAGQNATQSIRGIGGGSTMSAARYPWQSTPGTGGNGGQRQASGTTNYAPGSAGSATVGGFIYGPHIYTVGAGGGGGGAHGGTSGTVYVATAGGSVWGGYLGGIGATAGTTGSGYASGGGGGGGAGIVTVFAKDVSVTSTSNYLQANGGRGGNGYYTSSSVYGGGGGGGGGGSVSLFYQTNKSGVLPTLRATGGSYGSYGSSGGNGIDGRTQSYKIFYPDIQLDPASINFPAEVTSGQTIQVITDPQDVVWTISESISWAGTSTVSGVGSGSFVINCSDQINGGSARSGYLYVDCSNYSLVPRRSVYITQDSSALELTLGQGGYYGSTAFSSWDYDFQQYCDYDSFDVSANGPWTITPAYAQNNFYLSQYSGSAGNTTVWISYYGSSMESAAWTVNIGGSGAANIYCNSDSMCY
jgi:hypothetical protein